MTSKVAGSSHEEFVIQDSTPGHCWSWRLLMNLTIVGLALGLYGYDNAFVSPLLSLPLFVDKYQGVGFDGKLVFTASNLDFIVTIPIVGAALGAFAATPLQRYAGRKRGLLVAYSTMCIPGSILQLFAPSLAALVAGRFWNYFGISVLTNIAPIYLSELVPASLRARAVGFAVAGGSAVSVMATAIVWASKHCPDRRQYIIPLAIQAAAPVVLLLLSFLLTESPIWLLSRGYMGQAHTNLVSLRAGSCTLAEAELAVASAALRSNDEQRHSAKWWKILTLENLERTVVASALHSLSQVGGQILVTTYSTVILVQSGVGDPFIITVIISLLHFAGTVLGPYLLDRFGRRTVALPGYIILCLLDLAAGVLACIGLDTSAKRLALASLCVIFAFINAISFTSMLAQAYPLSPRLNFTEAIIWLTYLSLSVLPTEVPIHRLREPTMTWTMFWSYVTAVITTFAVPQLTSADAANLGARAFLIFAGCMSITSVLSFIYLPETANRTLVEITELYERRIPKRQWARYRINADTTRA